MGQAQRLVVRARVGVRVSSRILKALGAKTTQNASHEKKDEHHGQNRQLMQYVVILVDVRASFHIYFCDIAGKQT